MARRAHNLEVAGSSPACPTKTFFMEKHAIFQDMSPMERIRLLESNATEMVDGFTYQRNLDDDDLSEEEKVL